MIKVTYIISDINKALAFEWIAEKLAGSRIELSFILITKKPSELEGFLRHLNIPVTCFYYKNKKGLLSVFPRIYLALKKLKPDVVHCHLLYGTLVGLSAAWLAKIKKRIYTRHHSDFHHRYFPAGVKWDRLCNKLSTHIVAPSGAVKYILMEVEGVPADRITTIPHGFDLGYFRDPDEIRVSALRNKYAIGDHHPVIGVISRFTELKGVQHIVPAYRRLLEAYPNSLILFFNATGDHEIAIRELLSSIPEANYRLASFENDLASVYQLFDIFIQASIDTRIESFGQTYVEALAAGIPSIFTLSGIASDFIVDGFNALAVPFKNSDKIYDAMTRILTDHDLTQRLEENGWESVKERFALQKMLDELIKLYA